MAKKSIGIDVQAPKEKCNDVNCAFHGTISLRGRLFTGKVIKKNVNKTVTVEWPRVFFLKKYDRYEKKRTRIKAHNPDCINAEIGDIVKIAECRPIAKAKNFIVIEKSKDEK
ncbi:MAG: 30S ribosomal protein S17 [Candidatus Nanoarchaeia archaeon]|nr:30S ribosomal protein S17 [Candidatus Nanoarchaeia archaeon]MDD5587728.1 30S ribosomal protein S17 [Candidatus Nanoarchaeia archaeon]